MTINDLETGQFLDLAIQKVLERYFDIPADQLSIVDKLHAEEYELVLQQLTTSLSPVTSRTVVSSDIAYRIKYYNYQGMDLAHSQSKDPATSTFELRQSDIEKWNKILTKLLYNYYI